MSRLDHIPPEQMNKVISVATRLYDADRDATQERQSAVDAAAEMDIPREYLERAAAQVEAEHIESIKLARRRRQAVLAVVGVAAVIAVGVVVKHRPPPAPTTYTFSSNSDTTWNVNVSPGSQGSVSFMPVAGHGEVADIKVQSFKPEPTGEYFVNFDTRHVPANLGRYGTVTFEARGNGLSHVRLALEKADERWRSTVLSVDPSWRTYTLPLTEFEHQVRPTLSNRWVTDGTGNPTSAGRISFKLGQYVNDANATGDLQIDGIAFK